MPLIAPETLKLAILNVARHGDTDVFPFPAENHLFHDLPDELSAVLAGVDADFLGNISKAPVLRSKDLAVVGYSGFRWGTQIDPVWNAYLLALVIAIGNEIEARRVSPDIVFSYRFKPDPTDGSVFRKDYGWRDFQRSAVETAKLFPYVLRCDISDFYPRIYHHRLENALKGATTNSEIVNRVMTILSAISEGASYGLPVGGPAARLLSELLLNRVDRLLASEGIKYRRFVDDYVVFAASQESAHTSLIMLSTFLADEGLSLQKSKTRLMTSAEFVGTSDFGHDDDVADEEEERTFRRLRVHYDPYSPTAPADYEALLEELKKFDIVGMLGRQLAKSRIDEGLTRRLVAALRHLSPPIQNDAVASILKSLDLLYPIFPAVMLLLRALLPVLDAKVRSNVFVALRSLVNANSYITQVPANLAYALRVLAEDDSDETDGLMAQVYKRSASMMVKRDVILLMAYRGADYWVSHCRRTFPTVTAWERRAILMASYTLGDEGSHWRDSVKKDLSDYDKLLAKWIGERKTKGGVGWRLPI